MCTIFITHVRSCIIGAMSMQTCMVYFLSFPVARVSVLVQNCALISCSILIYLVLTYKAEISAVWANEALLRLCYVFIVVIAIVSNLTNMARNTAIERDWIVEICNKDKNMLASK